MDRRERSVEIREFKEDGLDDTTLKFSSLKQLDDYLGWYRSYSGSIIQKSKHDVLRYKYIIHDTKEPRVYYIIWKIDGRIVVTDEDIKRFYTGKMYKKKKTYMPIKIPKLSREDIYEAQERQKQRRRLLLLIDVKYGGIDHAEGTPELEELRQMIGAYEDERKKKRRNDTKRTRNKIKGI